MIERILVPKDVRPVTAEELKKPARRLTTYMDDRTVVPSELSDAPPLDGKTPFPQYLPLGVLVDRTLVPRGMAIKQFEICSLQSEFNSPEILGSRMVVPSHIEPLTREEAEKESGPPPEMTPELREVIEPDIFMTGDANLLMEPEDKRDAKSDLVHARCVRPRAHRPDYFPDFFAEDISRAGSDAGRSEPGPEAD